MRSWRNALKRTVKGYDDDHLTDWAAALTYYAVLSIFPGLLVLVSLLGLVGHSATSRLLGTLGTIAPGPWVEEEPSLRRVPPRTGAPPHGWMNS